MKVTSELNLRDFQFWSGAKQHEFTLSELDDLEYSIKELYLEELSDKFEGITETQINDLFWFEEEFLCECIGVDYDNDYLNR